MVFPSSQWLHFDDDTGHSCYPTTLMTRVMRYGDKDKAKPTQLSFIACRSSNRQKLHEQCQYTFHKSCFVHLYIETISQSLMGTFLCAENNCKQLKQSVAYSSPLCHLSYLSILAPFTSLTAGKYKHQKNPPPQRATTLRKCSSRIYHSISSKWVANGISSSPKTNKRHSETNSSNPRSYHLPEWISARSLTSINSYL